MNPIVNEINEHLTKIINSYPDSKVKEAMKYSLLAGGKRLRPYIFIQVLRSYQIDYHEYLDIACAIEMIHTYSLIHDDLPGMDDDDLRRGKNTCHKEFDEATAILAGDGLLNESMNVILNSKVDNELKVQLLKTLYQASGIQGMIYGQELDMMFENKQANIDELKQIHIHKTGCLITAPFVMAGIIAKSNDLDTWKKIGTNIGLCFQIQDDILDVTASSETLGKNANSDLKNNKSTYVSLLGIDASNEEVKRLINNALELLYGLRVNHGLIIELFNMVEKRVN